MFSPTQQASCAARAPLAAAPGAAACLSQLRPTSSATPWLRPSWSSSLTLWLRGYSTTAPACGIPANCSRTSPPPPQLLLPVPPAGSASALMLAGPGAAPAAAPPAAAAAAAAAPSLPQSSTKLLPLPP